MAAEERDFNLDPITDEHGAHPVGTGLGATGGALAGAATGAIGGPIGAAVGGVAGAVVGGLAGKVAGEAVNPTAGETGYDTDNVIATLSDLAECAKDGEYGFRASAAQVTRADLQATLTQRGDDCRDAAHELYDQIRSLGGSPPDGGTAGGAMHRGWVAVKTKLSGHDDVTVLDECERAEDAAVARYRKALKESLPTSIRMLVERQLQGAIGNHDRIKMLRDQARATA